MSRELQINAIFSALRNFAETFRHCQSQWRAAILTMSKIEASLIQS